jgi:alpha-L-fucosidase
MSQASPAGREWFQDARFGMFVHWGLYSLLARGEWVMFDERIAAADYEPLARRFDPTGFGADEWVNPGRRRRPEVPGRHQPPS